jgi:hypothetical protein
MQRRHLIALSVAAAFALPLTAQAGGDKASQGATGNTGADKMFQALDKNKDGFVSREEAKGTPHDKDFTSLDKNQDGKLTPQEHAAAPEHAGDKAASGATSESSGAGAAGSGSASSKKY